MTAKVQALVNAEKKKMVWTDPTKIVYQTWNAPQCWTLLGTLLWERAKYLASLLTFMLLY